MCLDFSNMLFNLAFKDFLLFEALTYSLLSSQMKKTYFSFERPSFLKGIRASAENDGMPGGFFHTATSPLIQQDFYYSFQC